MQRFLKIGFELKEDIIKHQHNCKATGFWVKKSKEANFLLISDDTYRPVKYSVYAIRRNE